MKKFYTLLSVALMGTMMVSAATRVTEAKPAALPEAKQFTEVKTLSTEAVSVTTKKAPAYKAPAKEEAAATASLDGEYIFKAYARNFDSATNGLPGAYWMNESVPYVEFAEDNTVTIEGFWDRPMVLEGTYDPEAATITIPYTQKITYPTQTGSKDLAVYVISFADMKASDLVLKVDAANRKLTWTPADNGQQYLETLLVGTYGVYNGSQIYDQMYDLTMDMINSVGYSWITDENGEFVEDENGEPAYAAYYSYTTVDKEAGKVSIENFLDFDGSAYSQEGSFGYPIEFTIDKEAQTLTASGQSIPLQFTATEWVPFELVGIEFDGSDFSVTDDFIMLGDEQALEDGGIVTAFECSGVGAGLFGEYQGKSYGQEFYMVEYIIFDSVFSGEDAGIANVVVDNNENAPVEYFNLQGVRVDNPAAGLYIRRQGNKTTKVLVK